MRYIGSKRDLLDFIYTPFREHEIQENIFFDAFAGTTVVAQLFKRKGFTVIANDIMSYSYVFARTYICTNSPPLFDGLSDVVHKPSLSSAIQFLNGLPGKKGFVYTNYSKEGSRNGKFVRNYFSSQNAQKIDAIRDTIEYWREEKLISEDAFYVLLCSLLEIVPSVSNIAGTYGAFLKIDDPRMFKNLRLTPPNLIFKGSGHECHNKDANELVKRLSYDVLYIDPPYNTRQYAANYHILEMITVWDKRIKDSKTGLIPWDDKKSQYCSRIKCVSALEDLIVSARCKYILMSYNSEGIIPQEEIRRIFSSKGELFEYKKTYRRFKSNSRGQCKAPLKELLFFTIVD